MSIIDRRKVGVNFLSVFVAAKEVFSDPDFEPGSKREMATAILEKIQGKKFPQLRQDDPTIDWDAIIRFIEAIMPLILLLLGGL